MQSRRSCFAMASTVAESSPPESKTTAFISQDRNNRIGHARRASVSGLIVGNPADACRKLHGATSGFVQQRQSGTRSGLGSLVLVVWTIAISIRSDLHAVRPPSVGRSDITETW